MVAERAASLTWRPAGQASAIDWVIIGTLLAASPQFLFPQIRFAWAFAVVPALLLVRGALTRRFIDRTALDAAVALLLSVVAVACYAVPDVTQGLGKIAGTLFGVLLYYAAVAVLKSERAIWIGTWTLVLVTVGVALVGAVDMDLYPEMQFGRDLLAAINLPKHHWNLPGAEFGVSPNALAGVMLLGTPVVLVMLLSGPSVLSPAGGRAARWLEKAALAVSAAVLLLVLLLSQSYGAWVGLPSALWLVVVSGRWKLWSLVPVLVLAGSIWSFGPRAEQLLRPTRANSSILVKIENRVGFWKTGLTAMAGAPLLGVGLNRLRTMPGVGYVNAHAHNQLLTVGAEVGVPGLAAYLAALLAGAWMAWVAATRARAPWMRRTAAGLLAGQLAFLMWGAADAVPLGAKVGLLFWLSFALIASMHRFTIRDLEEGL